MRAVVCHFKFELKDISAVSFFLIVLLQKINIKIRTVEGLFFRIIYSDNNSDQKTNASNNKKYGVN